MPHFIYINTPDASQATYFSHFVPLSVYGLMMKIIHILNSKLLWLLNYKGIQNWMHGEQRGMPTSPKLSHLSPKWQCK